MACPPPFKRCAGRALQRDTAAVLVAPEHPATVAGAGIVRVPADRTGRHGVGHPDEKHAFRAGVKAQPGIDY
jgi:hypothetical protein